MANLNYWAYWLGEISETHTDDGFMSAQASWDGNRILGHLVDRVTPGAQQLDLNVRTLWQLLLARPRLLAERLELRSKVAARVGEVLDCADLGSRVRRELSDIVYAIKLSSG